MSTVCLQTYASDEAPTVVTSTLPSGEDEHQAFLIPTAAEWSLEIDFPYPIADWAGRGFTPDPERFAGDFMIEAVRGSTRLYVSALAADAHRVLHVAFLAPTGEIQTVPLEFVPAPPQLAFRKLTFVDGAAATRPAVQPESPTALLPTKRSTPSAELALIRLMRLLDSLPPASATQLSATSPTLRYVSIRGEPADFGDFTVTACFVVEDRITGNTGICAELANACTKRILIDPRSWLVRSGNNAYRVRTVDFAGALDPAARARIFMVLETGANGAPVQLDPNQPVQISARVDEKASARPVTTYDVEPFLPR
jgi:hypothetical protein